MEWEFRKNANYYVLDDTPLRIVGLHPEGTLYEQDEKED